MVAPLMVAGGSAVVGAGLSLLAAGERNSAIEKQAADNFNASLQSLNQKRSVDFANLLYQADEVNRSIGMQLTQLGYEQRKATANTVVKTIDRNIYGVSAMKTNAQASKDAALLEDSIVQKGNAAMTDMQSSLSTANYSFNSGVYGASQNYANAMNQKQGTMEMLAGAAGAAVSFGSAGYGMAK